MCNACPLSEEADSCGEFERGDRKEAGNESLGVYVKICNISKLEEFQED